MLLPLDSNKSYLETGKQILKLDTSSVEYCAVPVRRRALSCSDYSLKKPNRKRTSSLGDIEEPSTRILLWNLTNALNESFPDYDFEDVKITQFLPCDCNLVMRSVNSYLAETTLTNPSFLERLWTAIDDIINIRRCEVFEFIPDSNDESAFRYVWNFHYFFFSKELKKLVYLSCSATRLLSPYITTLTFAANFEAI